MRKFLFPAALGLTLAVAFTLAGCGGKKPEPPHEHGDHDHTKEMKEQNSKRERGQEKKAIVETAPPTSTKVTSSGSPLPPRNAESVAEDHGHKTGEHGGIIVSLGRDSYHVEAIVTKTGELKLFTLGSDETRIQDIQIQELTAYIKPEGDTESTAIDIKAVPQPGDASGMSSLFVGQLPAALQGQKLDVTVPSITIQGERFRLGFSTATVSHADEAMPAKVADDAEKNLYLTPGGLYTAEDIKANGEQTASQKFKGFKASHDLKPQIGDKICPVTLTKANTKCTWVVGGKSYEFCCPPCVDEFVALAKKNPDLVKQPGDYVKRE